MFLIYPHAMKSIECRWVARLPAYLKESDLRKALNEVMDEPWNPESSLHTKDTDQHYHLTSHDSMI